MSSFKNGICETVNIVQLVELPAIIPLLGASITPSNTGIPSQVFTVDNADLQQILC